MKNKNASKSRKKTNIRKRYMNSSSEERTPQYDVNDYKDIPPSRVPDGPIMEQTVPY